MPKIAILYICTGKYDVFWKDFFESSERYFCPGAEVHYFVWTDAKQLHAEAGNERIHRIPQESLGWPGNTLQRYHMFLEHEAELLGFDYVFFFNANMQFVAEVAAEEFLPRLPVLVVQHPGYFAAENVDFPYDRNPASTACIPVGEGEHYVCGGCNGGRTDAFLAMARTLRERIDRDEANGVRALWFDESQINRYVIGRDDVQMLSPSFCYPEGWDLPFEPKVLVRDKSNWIDVVHVKEGLRPWQRALRDLYRRGRRFAGRVVRGGARRLRRRFG